MAKPAKQKQETPEAAPVDLDAIIDRLFPNGRPFLTLPDPDRDRYPASIHPTAPDDGTWRKSFKVWGCDLRDKSNPYWPYAFPTAAPLHPDMGYNARQGDAGYTLLDRNGNATRCVECKQTQHWKMSKGGLWQCLQCS